MSKAFLDSLSETFESAANGLKPVGKKKMFGCDAFFKTDVIFGLIWKTGRIGVKLQAEDDYSALMKLKGSAPWKIGAKVMSSWVLVPEDFHDDEKALARWIKTAHATAVKKAAAKKKTKAATKKTSAKAPKKKKTKRTAKR